MPEELVYVKTPKGIDEMNNRTFGLPQRARLVLIMIDGKCSDIEIAARFPDGEGEALLANLVVSGFVAPLKSASVATTSANKPIEKFAPPRDAAQRFEMAKNLMRNTINAFLGGMGSSLINQIDKCTNLDELRPLYKAWQDAILLTSDGRKQAKDLETRLAALLS